MTNTSRLMQWHDVVCEAPGDSRSDLWFVYHLGKWLKALYAGSTAPRDRAIQNLTWTYPERGARREPDAEAVLREINGYIVADRKQVESYQALKDDGSTACGGWMYTGIYPRDGHNVARGASPTARTAPVAISVGRSPDPPTAARSTTAAPPIPPASRGRSGRRWSGGMGRRASGPAPTCPISSRPSAPTTALTGASIRPRLPIPRACVSLPPRESGGRG